MADVIGAALEQGYRDRHFQRVAHERKIALIELILERLRTGGDDDLAAREQRRNEIGERLAGSGSGFSDQLAPGVDGMCDRFGHGQLLWARAISGKFLGERTVLAKNPCKLDGVQREFLIAPRSPRLALLRLPFMGESPGARCLRSGRD